MCRGQRSARRYVGGALPSDLKQRLARTIAPFGREASYPVLPFGRDGRAVRKLKPVPGWWRGERQRREGCLTEPDRGSRPGLSRPLRDEQRGRDTALIHATTVRFMVIRGRVGIRRVMMCMERRLVAQRHQLPEAVHADRVAGTDVRRPPAPPKRAGTSVPERPPPADRTIAKICIQASRGRRANGMRVPCT